MLTIMGFEVFDERHKYDVRERLLISASFEPSTARTVNADLSIRPTPHFPSSQRIRSPISWFVGFLVLLNFGLSLWSSLSSEVTSKQDSASMSSMLSLLQG